MKQKREDHEVGKESGYWGVESAHCSNERGGMRARGSPTSISRFRIPHDRCLIEQCLSETCLGSTRRSLSKPCSAISRHCPGLPLAIQAPVGLHICMSEVWRWQVRLQIRRWGVQSSPASRCYGMPCALQFDLATFCHNLLDTSCPAPASWPASLMPASGHMV